MHLIHYVPPSMLGVGANATYHGAKSCLQQNQPSLTKRLAGLLKDRDKIDWLMRFSFFLPKGAQAILSKTCPKLLCHHDNLFWNAQNGLQPVAAAGCLASCLRRASMSLRVGVLSQGRALSVAHFKLFHTCRLNFPYSRSAASRRFSVSFELSLQGNF